MKNYIKFSKEDAESIIKGTHDDWRTIDYRIEDSDNSSSFNRLIIEQLSTRKTYLYLYEWVYEYPTSFIKYPTNGHQAVEVVVTWKTVIDSVDYVENNCPN